MDTWKIEYSVRLRRLHVPLKRQTDSIHELRSRQKGKAAHLPEYRASKPSKDNPPKEKALYASCVAQR